MRAAAGVANLTGVISRTAVLRTGLTLFNCLGASAKPALRLAAVPHGHPEKQAGPCHRGWASEPVEITVPSARDYAPVTGGAAVTRKQSLAQLIPRYSDYPGSVKSGRHLLTDGCRGSALRRIRRYRESDLRAIKFAS